jgi:hypothetical protein
MATNGVYVSAFNFILQAFSCGERQPASAPTEGEKESSITTPAGCVITISSLSCSIIQRTNVRIVQWKKSSSKAIRSPLPGLARVDIEAYSLPLPQRVSARARKEMPFLM